MHGADVLLLDVQMPGLAGTELAARLKQQANPPAVVFVTAHAEHALKAFELDAVLPGGSVTGHAFAEHCATMDEL